MSFTTQIVIAATNASFVGSLLDLIGFCIITYDILPYYLVDKEIKKYERALSAAECIPVKAKNYDGSTFYVNDRSALSREVISIWKRCGGWNVSQRIEEAPDSVDIISDSEVEEMVPFINRIIWQRKMELKAIQARRRPPILLGIALVLIGYLFQMVGSL